MTSIDDFKAELVQIVDNKIVTRPLYVKAVDANAKTVTVKFNGADSGTYNIALVGKDIGRIDQSALELTVEGRVSGVTPLTGSYLGGTLITITGVNFSNDKYDNPVKAGDYWCDVQTTNPTQITCRVRETGASQTSSGWVSTFMATSEEAVKDVDTTYEFATPVATVSALAAEFDAATNTQVLTLTGSGFGTDHAGIELMIDGQKQTSVSATDTEAKFTMTHLDSESANVVQIYFPDGFPTGYDTIRTVAVTPNLVSISPATGSAGGTLLTVTGTGFGSKTEGLTLVDSNDSDVCDKVEIIGYGQFTCQTKAIEIEKTNALKLKTSAASYACGNSVATECEFEQLTASSPTVSDVQKSDGSTLAVTGTNFPT